MNSSFSVLKTILFVGAVQGILLALILLAGKKRNFPANRVLSFILLIFSFSIAYHVLTHTGLISEFFPHELFISVLFTTLGPCLYLYVKTLLNPVFRLTRKDLLHFLLFIILFIIALPLFLFVPRSGYFNYGKAFLNILILILTPFYILLSFLKLNQYQQVIRNNFSSIEKINLKWLYFVITFFIVFWLSGIVFWILSARGTSFDVFWLIVSVLIYTTGYLGFIQPELFGGETAGDNHKRVHLPKGRKYEKSTLTGDAAKTYYQKLNHIMEEKKLFLQSNLTLSALAGELKISTHHLSQILNDRIGKNFYDYINGQRIKEAKRLLISKAYQNQNIAAVGYDVGFNSLSAFNSAFKKFTSHTPTEFKKKKKDQMI